jgi:aminoglycoside/choline kinase family phosphotransferase
MNVMNAREDAMAAFLSDSGWSAAERRPLPGDASTRRYIRLHLGSHSAMLMDQPQQSEAPAAEHDSSPQERRALGYNALARLAGADCARFVVAADYLRAQGLAAPQVYAADTVRGFLLLEDLGDDLYADVLGGGADERALYESAIDALVRLHTEAAPETLAPGKPLFAYDETAQLAETDLLVEWFLPQVAGRSPDPAEVEEHRTLWRTALSHLDRESAVFVHRDYHAQNLLWRGGKTGLQRVGVIDFQDAVAGAPAYDLVSLLEDARRDVAPGLAEQMLDLYLLKARAAGRAFPACAFRVSAALLAAQRNAKIIGIFARLAKRDGKPRYLAHLPRVWRYMERDLSHPVLAPLKAWYDCHIPREARGAWKPVSAGAVS